MRAFFIFSLEYFSMKHAAFINKNCFLVMAVHLASDSQSVITASYIITANALL